MLLAQSVIEGLKTASYQVEWARSLHEAWFHLEKSPYDALIIDRCVEDGDGLEVVAYLHEHSYQTKMLILSHQNQVAHRVEGLQAGADEYMAKPFSLKELLLRLDKLLHQTKLHHKQEITVGCLIFYPQQGHLYHQGIHHILRKREAEVFHCLCLHVNQVLSRRQIASWVWPNNESMPSNKSIDTYIKRVRAVMGSEKEIIETVRGFGYRLHA